MTTTENRGAHSMPFGRRLRWAGLSIILGLLIQLSSLSVTNPVTFMLFLGPGVFLVLLGAALFLWAVFAQSQLGWNDFTDGSS